MKAPEFTVERGNPTDKEIAALSAVLTQLSMSSAKEANHQRNLWGMRGNPRRDHVFNPNAFRNVTFY